MRFRWAAFIAAVGAALAIPLSAQGALSVTPITWNVVGLDSNNPGTGPRNFPVGERICSTSATGPVTATLVWDSANPYIGIRPGTLNPVTVGPLAAGGCADAYFEVEIVADAAAFDTTRRFHVTATDGAATASSPTPRELYVEHLVSQNRNGITAIKLNGTTIPAGGSMTLMVGNTYEIELDGFTATQGYNQLESFINLSNAVFQVLAVTSAYSSGGGGNSLYANACIWDPVPGSPNYNSCIGPDLKAGGTVVIKYTVRIVSGAGTTQTLNTLLYDFSGSSFHYNADYSTGARIASIVSPASVGITKSFSPRAIAPNGTSAMTFRLTNPTSETFTSVNFADTLTGGLKVASPLSVSVTNCGAGAFSPALAANATQLNFQGATLSPNSTCTITVNVTAPAGTYPNTTGHLYLNGTIDTGNSGSDTLTASSAPACVPGQTLAQWTFTAANATNPTPSSQASNVATAIASTTTTSPATAGDVWTGSGFAKQTPITDASPNFLFQVDTSKYSNVTFSVSYQQEAGSWGGGGTSTPTFYVFSSTTGTNGSYASVLGTTNFSSTLDSTTAQNLAVTSNGAGSTWFRINAVGANNGQSKMTIDNVVVKGCGVPAPAPTIAKSFLTNPAVVNGTSTLQFSLGNTAVGNVALTGIAFSDVLPATLTVADSTFSACGGTVTTVAATRTISLAGGTLAAGGSCTIPVLIGASAVGQYDNVTGYVSATESGTSTNYATATLTVIAPPRLAKSFAPASVITGQSSTLAFTIVNPNPLTPLTAVTFSDTLPLGLTVANASGPACGGTYTVNAANRKIDLAGGALAANASCTFSVPVVGAAPGVYTNTTGAVSAFETGPGAVATAELSVADAMPLLGLGKQVSTDGTHFTKSAAIAPPQNVWWRFTISNDGEVTLDGINVSDSFAAMGTCTPALPTTLLVGEQASCVVGPTNIPSTPAPNPFVNTATATTTTYTPAPPLAAQASYGTKALALDKTATETYFLAAGNVLSYTYLVTNTGGYPLVGPLSVNDDRGTVTCPPLNTINDLDDYLAPGESATCTATYVVTAADVTAGSVTNTAVATVGSVQSAADSVTVPLAANLTATKTNNVGGSTTTGGAFTWTLTVANAAGGGTATFANGQGVLKDDLPSSGATYAIGAISAASGFSGAVNCGIAGNTLTCTANGTVTFPAGATLVVPITVTTTASGALANPRAGGVCAADPDNVVPETNEGDNACANSVNVGGAPPPNTADLAIAKSRTSGAVTPGGTVSYSIVASNNGPSAVTGATVADTLPAALGSATWTCVAAGGGSCTAAGSGNINDVAVNLPVGATATYTVSATLAANATGSLANTATIAPPAGVSDPTPGNNTSSTNDAIAPAADLAIVKTRTGPVTPGAAVSYTIVVTNNGPSAVTGATVSDALPAALTGATWTCVASAGGSCTASGSGNIGDSAVNLPANATATYSLTATLAANASGSLANTATAAVPAGTTDPTPGNNSSTATDPIQPSADLAITKTNGVSSVTPGTSVTYTITATNHGPSVANGATVTDALPASLGNATWTCAAAAGATCTASGSGNIADTVNLPVNATVTYTLVATLAANATGTLTNTATVAAPAGTTDPTPGNDAATDSDPIVASVGLAVTKDDGSASYTPGGSATYNVTVTNSGPSVATNLTVSDALPAGVTLSAGASCTPTGNATCGTLTGAIGAGAVGITGATLGTAPGDKLLIAVPVNFASSLTANPLVNSVTVTDVASGQTVSATDSDTRAPQVSIAVAKSDGAASYTPGGSATYQVTVSNTGLTDAVDVAVTDALPAGVTLTGAPTCAPTGLATCGTVTGAAGGSAFGAANAAVPAGGGSTLVYSLPVAFAANLLTDPLVNTAQATDVATGATGSASDSDTRSASVTLALTKDDGTAFYTPGGGATYTITVRNTGVSAASNVTVSDTLPAGVTLTGVPACTPAGTAVCGTVTGASGGTSFGATGAVVPAGAGNTLTFAVPVQFAAGLADDPLINTVTATDLGSGANGSASDSNVRLANGALGVSKTDGSATYTPGGSATYTVVVTNAGPSNAGAITVSDPLPGGVTLTGVPVCTPAGTATCGTVTGAAGGNSFGTSGATLAAGAGNSLTFTAPVAFAPGLTTTPLVNTVSVASPDTVTPATASDSNTLASSADLAVTKTDGVATVTAGTGVTYTIVATNAGPSNVVGATVTDTLPAALTGATWSCVASSGASCTAAGTGSISDTVTLAAGASVTYTVNATLSLAAAGTLSNTATIATPAGVTDPVPGNNAATDSDTIVAPQADLAITKTDGTTSVTAGGTVIYTIVASNAGPAAVSGATVGDALPAGLTNATWTCAAGGGATCAAAGAGSIADVVSLPVGGTATYTLTATLAANATGTLVNTATVAAPSGVVDPNPANNSATDTDTIVVPVQSANLGITKTDGLATVAPGQQVTYTLVVSNAGPSAANGAKVADVLPAALSGATWTCVAANGATCTASGNGNVNDTVNLPAGGTATYTITATLATTATGTLANTATVTPPAGVVDPVPGNNTATDTDTIVPLTADLIVSKSDGVTSVTTGQALTYTIVVVNTGPSAVTGAKVDDTLPAALTNATWTCAAAGGGSCTASGTGSLHDTVNLPVNAMLTYTLKATVAANASGALVNTVSVTPPAGVVDPNPGNNTATDTDAINGPAADLAITKTDGVTTVTPGQKVTYTIVVGNSGPQAVTGAAVSDPLPASLSGATWTCVAAGGASCTPSGSGGINDTVNLPVGGTATYTLTATLSASATGTLANTATVTPPAGVVDPNPANNTATDTDAIGGGTGLTIGKSDGSTTYTPGGTAVYTIVVGNTGAANATGVTVTDALPAGVTLTAVPTCSATGNASCGTVTGTVGGGSAGVTGASVAAGAGNGLTLTVPVQFAASLTTSPLVNTAVVKDAGGSTASASDSNIIATLTANVKVVKTGPATVAPGGAITWSIAIDNAGPAAADGATFSDPLPAGVTSVTATCGGETGGALCGSIGLVGGVVSGTIAKLPMGGHVAITIKATAPQAGGTLTNTVTVKLPAGMLNPDPGSLSSSAATSVPGGGGNPAEPIPVDSAWALALLVLVLGTAGGMATRRQAAVRRTR